jgi:predicted methyltransferase
MPESPLRVFLDQRGATVLGDAALKVGAERQFGPQSVEVSLDLNLTTERVDIDERHFVFHGKRFLIDGIREISHAVRKIFRATEPPEGGTIRSWEPVRVFTGHYFQLVPTPEAPTVEIDGIQMHRTAGIHPFAAAGEFAAAVVRPGARVLDTCGGLGYTAIQALRLGAAEVRSYEVSEGVLQLRAINPWSQLEPCGERLRLETRDVFRGTAELPPGSFDAIIHDPPRYALAPDLYSSAFYLRLRSLLRAGGAMFHYTGDPNSRRRGSSTVRRVIERLRAAGFETTPRPDLQGIIARRDRRRGHGQGWSP